MGLFNRGKKETQLTRNLKEIAREIYPDPCTDECVRAFYVALSRAYRSPQKVGANIAADDIKGVYDNLQDFIRARIYPTVAARMDLFQPEDLRLAGVDVGSLDAATLGETGALQDILAYNLYVCTTRMAVELLQLKAYAYVENNGQKQLLAALALRKDGTTEMVTIEDCDGSKRDKRNLIGQEFRPAGENWMYTFGVKEKYEQDLSRAFAENSTEAE